MKFASLMNLSIAMRALRVNKMRSILTMLGIVIGVAAVIAMIAIGGGAQQRLQEQIASLGSNLLIVVPGSIIQSGARLGAGNAQTLTEQLLPKYPMLPLQHLFQEVQHRWYLVTLIGLQVSMVFITIISMCVNGI